MGISRMINSIVQYISEAVMRILLLATMRIPSYWVQPLLANFQRRGEDWQKVLPLAIEPSL